MSKPRRMAAWLKKMKSPVFWVLLFAAFAAVATALGQPFGPRPARVAWSVESNWPPPEVGGPQRRPARVDSGGHLIVPAYHRVLLTKDAADTVNAVEAVFLLEENGVADLLLGYEDHTTYRFRISRHPNKSLRSGLFRVKKMKTDSGAEAWVPRKAVMEAGKAEDVVHRTSLLNTVSERRFAYTVRLERSQAEVRAFLNGQLVAAMRDEGVETAGTAGFYAPLDSPLSFSVEDVKVVRAGMPDFTDDFAYRLNRRTIGFAAIRAGGLVLAVWLGLALMLRASLRMPFVTLVRKAAVGFIPLLFLYLLFGLSHPLETRVAGVVILGAAYLIVLSRNHRQGRWRIAASDGEKAGVSISVLRRTFATSRVFRFGFIGLLCLAVVLPLATRATGKVRVSTPLKPILAEGLDESAVHSLQVGKALGLGMQYTDFRVKAKVRLGVDSTLEMPFRMISHDDECAWYALRLTTGGKREAGLLLPEREDKGCGFVRSFGAERDGKFLPPLKADREYTVAVGVTGSRATVSLDDKPWDEFDVSGIRFGDIGFVQRRGSSTVSGASIAAVERERRFLDGAIGRGVLVGLVLLALPLGALVAAAVLAWATRIPFGGALKAEMALLAVFYVVLLIDPNGALIPIVGLIVWLLCHILFLIVNRDMVRGHTLWILLLLFSAIALLEPALRSTELRKRWQSDWQGGYVSDDFLVRPYLAPMVRASYLRMPDVRGVAKERPPTRVLCLGGSTTRGYGTRQETEAYPRLLADHSEYEAINAGFRGLTTMDVLLYFDRDLKGLKPDAIVLRAGGNDGMLRPVGMTQWQQWKQKRARGAAPGGAGGLRRSRLLFGLAALVRYEMRTFPAAFAERSWLGRLIMPEREKSPKGTPNATPEEFRNNVARLVEYARKNGIFLILVEEPNLRDFFAEPPTEDRYAKQLRELAEAYSKVEYVPLGDLFAEHYSDTLFVDHIHCTRQGNQRIAEAVREALDKRQRRRDG